MVGQADQLLNLASGEIVVKAEQAEINSYWASCGPTGLSLLSCSALSKRGVFTKLSSLTCFYNFMAGKRERKQHCDAVTLSTPALRMKLPFLFHFRAKIGPLCCPSVLARFPVDKHKVNLLSDNASSSGKAMAV